MRASTFSVSLLVIRSPEQMLSCSSIRTKKRKHEPVGHPHPDGLVLYPRLLHGVTDSARCWDMIPGIGAHWDEMHLTEQRH